MRYILTTLATLPLCGCNAFQNAAQGSLTQNAQWTTGAAFTTADVRMISQRTHPVFGNPIICTEPSPDVAKALSTAVSLTAQGGDGAASGSLGGSAASATAVTELAGRSTALLGLRDGLYRACEAYANGAIGQTAYALILSRYGQLETTLFLGQDVTGAAGVEGTAAAVNAALQASGNQQSPATPPSSGNNAPGSATPPGASKQSASASNAATPTTHASTRTPAGATMLAATSSDGPQAKLLRAVDTPPDSTTPSTDTTPTAAPANSSTTGSKSNQADSTQTTQPQSASAAGVSTAAALTLGRMNEDYFNLDNNLVHLLVVSCISENDNTRLRSPIGPDGVAAQPTSSGPGGYGNPWLARICDGLTLPNIQKLQAVAVRSAVEMAHGAPSINPEVAAVQLTLTSSTKSTATPPTSAVDAVVVAVQLALQKQSCAGCNPGAADGKAGKNTKAAVVAYQKFKGLTVNGNPKDPATLKSLGVTVGGAPVNSAQQAAPVGAAGEKKI